jgi:hypothetical protein
MGYGLWAMGYRLLTNPGSRENLSLAYLVTDHVPVTDSS